MAYIRCRDGKYSFTISLGKNKEGKRLKKEFGGFRTQKEAEDAYALKLAEYNREGELFEPANITVGQAWKEYINAARLTLKSTTITRQTSIYTNHIKKFENEPLKNITQAHLNEMQLELQPTLKANYIRTILMVWNNLFKFAIESNYIKINPIAKTKKIRVENEETKIPTEDELVKIEGVLLPQQKLPFMLAKHLGLRAGEVLGLRWHDFNWNEGKYGSVTISRQLLVDETNTKFSIGSLKTPKSHRTLFLNEPLSLYLKEIIVEQRANREGVEGYIKEHTFYSTIENKDIIIDDLVCVRENGAFLRHNNISNLSKCIRDKLGYDWFHFHTLRHYWASFLLKNRISIATVSKMLGHSSIETTLRIYSHSMPSELDDLFGALNNL